MAGTHIYNVVVQELTRRELSNKEQQSLDWFFMLNTAIDNLHKCLWIGIFEEMNRGLEMLRYQTGFKIKMMRLNTNKVKYPELTLDEINQIKSLMPMDLYLYQYAKKLHEHRWNIYVKQRNNLFIPDRQTDSVLELPSIIRGCKSTRYWLGCPKFTYMYPGTAENVAPVKN